MWHTYMVKSTYMWMDGQYDVVEVENKDVVHLGNSKVAASWTRIFFDEHVAWICGFGTPALSIFCTTILLIGSGLWALLVDIEGQ